jgi:hypothetical protein
VLASYDLVAAQPASAEAMLACARSGQVDIIDPRETRQMMEEFVEDAQEVLRSQLGQTSRVPYLP